MTDVRPTAEDLAKLKADLNKMTGPELLYAALTDDRLDWLDEPADRGKPWRTWLDK